MTKFLIILGFFLCAQAFAQANGKVDLSLRTKPLQYNGVGTIAYDGLIWGQGEKTNPMYGFYRVGAKLGGSPTAAAFLQVAPVAPVVFEIQKSTTYRFIKTSAVNCDTFECLHKVDRTDYSLRIGGAYEKFILLTRFTLRDIETEKGTKPVFLELEAFNVTPDHDYRYFESSVTAGYKLDDIKTAGILYVGGEITGSRNRFTAGYGFYSHRFEQFSVTGALGYYDNSYDKFRGVSGVVILSKSFGETLSLF